MNKEAKANLTDELVDFTESLRDTTIDDECYDKTVKTIEKIQNVINDDKKLTLENRKINLEMEKLKFDKEKYEDEKANNTILQIERDKKEKKNKIIDICLKVFEIAMPLAVNTALVLMNFRLIYKDDGRVPSEMKDLMKHIYR